LSANILLHCRRAQLDGVVVGFSMISSVCTAETSRQQAAMRDWDPASAAFRIRCCRCAQTKFHTCLRTAISLFHRVSGWRYSGRTRTYSLPCVRVRLTNRQIRTCAGSGPVAPGAHDTYIHPWSRIAWPVKAPATVEKQPCSLSAAPHWWGGAAVDGYHSCAVRVVCVSPYSCCSCGAIEPVEPSATIAYPDASATSPAQASCKQDHSDATNGRV